MNRKLILSVILLGFTFSGLSYNWDANSNGMINHGDGNNQDDSRAAGCSNPTDFIYLNFNNVKARIETGGLMWQDRSSSSADYTVPSTQEISVIYAGALWMGGQDINGQLKLAAQKFGAGRDFWTGPLSTNNGNPGNANQYIGQPITADIDLIRAYGDAEIIPEECAKYDEVFTVRKTEVTQFITYWNCTYGGASAADCEDVPELDPEILQRIVDWPAHGDPALGQDFYLAPFFDNPDADAGANGVYDPIGDGDYPWYDVNKDIDFSNDRRVTLFGDETNWWVFNDKGNIHTETGGDPIGMEVRAQAFTFATNDAINDMTFYNYELINRGTQTLYNTYFSQYVDPDIGGSSDDYVGCDVSRGLGYAYNGNTVDAGTGGATWGANPPAVGIDFFEGPYQDVDNLDNPLTTVIADAIANKGIPYEGLGIGYGDNIIDNERMGMRRFTYYSGGAVAPQTDPSSAAQYYGFMQGFWGTSGLATTYGGSGINGSIEANYMFPGDSDPLFWGTAGEAVPDWSEVSENNPAQDRRFVQSAGPFTLKPGAVNNLTVGVVYGRSYDGDIFASVRAMKRADTKAQALFDAGFQIVEPPKAPTLTIQELENELVLFLASPAGIDNIEEYSELDEVNIPATDEDGNPYDQWYRFQGYQIFQMVDDVASISDITDNSKARLVGQCDLEDGVDRLVNYVFNEETQLENGAVMVEGSDEGLRHSFHITEDLFATGSRTLVNHKKYYFIAVAYGYNGYKEFIPGDAAYLDGQKTPYLVSRQNGIGGSIKSVLGIPHNVAPEANGTISGTYYGWSPKITQVDGLGNGGRFVNLDPDTETEILASNSVANPIYALGEGPIDVKVVDPLNVREGEYTLAFANDVADSVWGLSHGAKWTITRVFDGVSESIIADYSINTSNEQIIPEWGISVNIKQIYYTSPNGNFSTDNLFLTTPIDGTLEFEDSSKIWLTGVFDTDQAYPTNWIRSGTESRSRILDGTWVDAPTCDASLWYNNDCYYDDYGNGFTGDSKNADPEQLFEGILNGTIAPFKLSGYQTYGMPLGSPDATSAALYPNNGRFKVEDVQKASLMGYLNDIDVVFTSDKANWTRCVVFEINDNEDQTVGGADVMELRNSPSVDENGNASSTENGRGWFPGYAIDVTTGERLNMAFSENSWLAGENGDDMIWNPTSRTADNTGTPLFGGMHYVYVFGANNDMPVYDKGDFIFSKLSGTGLASDYRDVFQSCEWVIEPLLAENHELLETDARIRMRVNKPYAENTINPGINKGRPMYKFTIDENSGVQTNNNATAESALDLINIVPNPYYAYNTYETGKLDNRVKITNLPEACNVTIYNMQGALIRQYSKDDPLTSLDWDLKNHAGISIAGGMYIIHVDVEGVGEKVIKWFGALRAPDLDNL
jgi:hypothetical protein